MEDGAALLQFEGSWVFTEVLGDGIVQSLQLLERGLHVGQLGLGTLRKENVKGCKGRLIRVRSCTR